mgnify:CR=1 FL=1
MTRKTGRARKSKAGPFGETPFVNEFFPYLLAHAHSLLTRHVTAFAAAENSSRNEFRVLVTLVGNDDLSLGRLAEMMQVKQPTLSRIIDKLVASGLVDRRESSDDRRSVKIRLSRLGRREVKPLLKRARTLNDGIISSLGAEDSKNLKRILERIIENEKSAG